MAQTTRTSTLDVDYTTGDLSVFPNAIDDFTSLYEATNNAQTRLKQSLSLTAQVIVVDDASSFPSQGIVRIGPPPGEAGNFELIYYSERTNSTFKGLVRGFARSIHTSWSGENISVTGGVMAEHHNAVKDAILNIENRVGTQDSPAEGSLNNTLKALEARYLAPKAQFRAFPTIGAPPLAVRFQNFSGRHVIRFLWDFGDGSTSIERNPTHTYTQEGLFTVSLNVITTNGAQGEVSKPNYINVSEAAGTSFYFVKPLLDQPNYSVQTATELSASPQEFLFIDQTDGDIAQRFWVFGDGTSEQVDDPDIHTTTKIYDAPGTYSPSLLVVFSDERLGRVFLQEQIVVI